MFALAAVAAIVVLFTMLSGKSDDFDKSQAEVAATKASLATTKSDLATKKKKLETTLAKVTTLEGRTKSLRSDLADSKQELDGTNTTLKNARECSEGLAKSLDAANNNSPGEFAIRLITARIPCNALDPGLLAFLPDF